MKHRTTPALLVVVALLLALNLAAALPWPTAQAQDEPEVWPPPVVKVVQISGAAAISDHRRINRVYRLWSDGTIEYQEQVCGRSGTDWCAWRVVPDPVR